MIIVFYFDFYFIYSRYDYEEEEEYNHKKPSNAFEMPETFGNAPSSSRDRNGSQNHHHSSSSDSYRDKKYK